ncbi:hypothetical protein [Actinosynnema sp. NPDC020468]|uniref:hypothetical protein n=1 Tax=Actinosynnema sp. NPDC020468 TaxID=3154488 RepID=UPI00340A976B
MNPTIADLAREVVRRIAPEQSEYLELVVVARERGVGGTRRPWDWSGGAVGSGSPPDVLTDVIFPLLTGTIAQVWGASAFAHLQRRRWWRRRGQPKPSTRVVLDASRIEDARAACVAHGMTLGLTEPEAAMLADAVVGVLRGAADGGRG